MKAMPSSCTAPWSRTSEFIVTGNKRHFPSEACDPVRVVSAGELLDRITLEI